MKTRIRSYVRRSHRSPRAKIEPKAPRAIEALALEVEKEARLRSQVNEQMLSALRECRFFVQAMTEHGANHPEIEHAHEGMAFLSSLLDQIKTAIDGAELMWRK